MMSILQRYDESSNKPESLAEAILFRVMDALNGRGGFDHWWHRIDADIQEDILNELAMVIETELTDK